MSDTAVCFAPREAATGKPLKLALQRLWLTGRILPAGARVSRSARIPLRGIEASRSHLLVPTPARCGAAQLSDYRRRL